MSAFRDILPTDEPPSDHPDVRPPATVFDRLLDELGTAPVATDGGRDGPPPIQIDCAACDEPLDRHSRRISGPDQVYDHVRCPDPDCDARGTIVRDRESERELSRVGPALPAKPPATATATEETSA